MFRSEIRSTSDDVLSALKRHSSIAQNQRYSDSKFSKINSGARWSSGRYRNSRSMHESGNSKGIQDIPNTKASIVSPPEQKVFIRSA